MPSGMLGLAISARVQAAGVDGDNLNEWVATNLW